MAFNSDSEAKEHFWTTVANRALEIPFCAACKTFFWYPRPFCPTCWSDAVEFRASTGMGTIWTYTIVRFAHGAQNVWQEKVPYVVALVTLDERVRIMGNVIGCDVDSIRSGQRVRLTYHEVGDRTLPAFLVEGP